MADSQASAPDKLSLVVFSGGFERVHYALVMASAAAAMNRPVTLFFTMEGARALMADAAWRALPATGGTDGGAVDDGFKANQIGDFEQLLAACRDLGVSFMVCEMGLRALGLAREDLRGDLDIAVGGVVTFLEDASRDGAMVFI